MFQCWKCGSDLAAVSLPFTRSSRCPACGVDLYVCRQCEHYDARYHNACREERAEPPREADRANFCDWFRLSPSAYTGGGDASAAARSQLEALFGGVVSEEKPAANPLDELFKK